MRAMLICLLVLASSQLSATGCGNKRATPEGAPHVDSGESHESGHGAEESGAHSEHVELSPEAIQAAGIQTADAGSALISVTAEMPGEITPNADRLAHIVPRFAGIAKSIRKSLGDSVRQDEVLAIVEGNESLAPYEVRSLISGTVIERHITLGEFVRDDADIFVVADLSTVWLNITVYPRELDRVRRGQRVIVQGNLQGASSEGRIDYIGPVLAEPSRAATARVVLENRARYWRPGMFVSAKLVVSERRVPVAVVEGAIQRFEGNNVVFVQEGEHFAPRAVQVGVDDGRYVEILSGLDAGERYVSRGSFVIKSELLKSEAGHEH